jgi:hypothetical protein
MIEKKDRFIFPNAVADVSLFVGQPAWLGRVSVLA